MVVCHVDVVKILLRRLLAVAAVGGNRLRICIDRLLPPALPHVDVRRHMNQMAEARLKVP
jgi:hypothetical protein